MWTYFKTKRLNVLAILAGLTYAFLIVNSFASEWNVWQVSFNEKTLGEVHNKWGDVVDQKPVESTPLLIKAIDGYTSFPDSMVNLVNHQTFKAQYGQVILLGPPIKPKFSMGEIFVLSFLLILLFVVSIRIPIHFYKFIGMIKRELIYERKSISLLRWIGLELLVNYLGGYLILYMFHQFVNSQFYFSNYEIKMGSMDPIWLFLGIVVLLLAEMLSKGLALREEQELTI
ncbi:MAG TPA: DUF2975 domain-containing protein [Prolixibacteraceae bacterium]|jgi:hypothetical protein